MAHIHIPGHYDYQLVSRPFDFSGRGHGPDTRSKVPVALPVTPQSPFLIEIIFKAIVIELYIRIEDRASHRLHWSRPSYARRTGDRR